MQKIGIGLIVVGLVGLLLSSVSFSTQETVVDAGPMEIEQEKERTLPIPPYAAVAVVLAGGALVVVDRFKS
jgi:hypothetical protein